MENDVKKAAWKHILIDVDPSVQILAPDEVAAACFEAGVAWARADVLERLKGDIGDWLESEFKKSETRPAPLPDDE